MSNRNTKNVILIGQLLCGKTVLGQRAAEKLGYRFVDLDPEAAKRHIIQKDDHWLSIARRVPEIQKVIIEEMLADTDAPPMILATNASTVMDWEDTQNLRKLGFVVHIERDEKLRIEKAQDRFPFVERDREGNESDGGYFLFLVCEKMISIYTYKAAADATLVNNGTIEEATDALVALINKPVP